MRSVWLRRTGRHRRSEAHAPLEEWEATPLRSPSPDGGAGSDAVSEPKPGRRTGKRRRFGAEARTEDREARPRGSRSDRAPHRTGTPPEGGAASRRGAQPPPLAGRFPRLIGDPPDDCGTVPLAHRRPFRRWSAPGTAAVDIGRTQKGLLPVRTRRDPRVVAEATNRVRRPPRGGPQGRTLPPELTSAAAASPAPGAPSPSADAPKPAPRRAYSR